MNEMEKDAIHSHYQYLSGIPNALAKVYLSMQSWDFSSILHFHSFLRQCEMLRLAESIELLLPM